MTFFSRVLMIRESGIIQTSLKRWQSGKKLCHDPSSSAGKPIGIEDIQSAFYVCAIMITLASISLVLEVTCRRGKCSRKEYPIQRGDSGGMLT